MPEDLVFWEPFAILPSTEIDSFSSLRTPEETVSNDGKLLTSKSEWPP